MNIKEEEKIISTEKNEIEHSESTKLNNEINNVDEVNQIRKEEIQKTQDEEKKNDQLVVSYPKEFVPVKDKNTKKKKMSLLSLVLILIICLLLLSFIIFTAYNIFNTNIISGVHIKDIDVSNMSTSDAKYKIDNYLKEKLPEEIKLVHGDYQATISLSQINAYFDTKSAVNTAYNVGRQGNIFENNIYVLSNMFGYTNIEPNIKVQIVVEITLTPVMLAAIPAAILFNDSVSIIAINSFKVM